MAKCALVFSGRNGLDFSELRSGVLRIPEVSLRVKEAQRILDAALGPSFDLLGMISADDESFFRNIQLKSLAAAIVQVGLYDRFLKTQKRPGIMIGNSNGDSALAVCSGRQSFQSMVESSSAASATIRTSDVVIPLVAQATPLLSGLTLTEYSALEFKSVDGGPAEFKDLIGGMELRKLVGSLHQEHDVTRFINVGPAGALSGTDYRLIGDGEIEYLDSIDLDPMLGWFWSALRPQAIAFAQ